MADVVLNVWDSQAQEYIPVLHHDNGDGTFSPVAYIAAGVELEAGDIQIGAVEVKDATGANRLVVDADGRIGVTVAAPLNSTSVALEKSRVAKGSAGTLFGFSGFNDKSSSQYIQLHDAAALPADTAVPVITFEVAPKSPFQGEFGPRGRAFANGIVLCSSSTLATKTLGAASDCWFDVQYV